MPLYEYQCADCGCVFERMQKISDSPPANCDKCHGTRLTKLISQTAFVLKGGGWYNDGYGSKKSGGSADTKDTATKAPSPSTNTEPSPAKTEATKDSKSDSPPKKPKS